MRRIALLSFVLLAATPGLAFAQDAAPALSGADTAWLLVSTALVLLMTPALAFFYGGLVRSKNALNTMMMSFIALGIAGVLWALRQPRKAKAKDVEVSTSDVVSTTSPS